MADMVSTTVSLLLLLVLLTTPAETRHDRLVAGPASRYQEAGPVSKHRQAEQPARVQKATTRQKQNGTDILKDVVSWNIVTYDFSDSPGLEEQLRDSGNYIPLNIFPFDIEVDRGPTIIVTTPPLREGVPATLGVVSETRDALKPYPSWEVQGTIRDSIEDCSSTLVAVTALNRPPNSDNMYAVDVGMVNIEKTRKILCPPKLVIIKLSKRSIIRTLEITEKACNFFFSAIVLEEEDRQNGGTVAYIADEAGFEIIVVDLRSGKQHRAISVYFHPDPDFGVINAGITSYMMRGVSSLGLTWEGELFASTFSSNQMHRIATYLLQDPAKAAVLDDIWTVPVHSRRDNVSDALFTDGDYVYFAQNFAIYRWRRGTYFHPTNFHLVTFDRNRLEFVSEMKINERPNHVWILSNSYHRFLEGKIDNSTVNYRIMYFDIFDSS